MEERERIEGWRSRLLQLDRRNRLLYCRRGKGSVSIIDIAPDVLASRLLRGRTGLRFDQVLPPSRGARNAFESESAQDSEASPRVLPGELTTSCEPAELGRRLRSLQRRDRTWEEEQGLNVLFLGMGFLNWIDKDGVEGQAPLLLLPCNLLRNSPREPYRLVREDEDPISNPTLRHVLAQFGLTLPEFTAADSTENPIAAYLDQVRTATASRSDWSVDAGIELGVFSHAKQAIYEDLGRIAERGFSNDLARRMAGAEQAATEPVDGSGPATPSVEDLAGGRLDDLLKVGDQYAVLDADFSQLRAIELARQGGNLVIHGPPGTGKSQTIANIVASLLADGKRILFVSEKSAALDVVKRRLAECSLDVFCLDLHSSRGRKSSVYEQLRQSLYDQRDRVGPDISLKELARRRNSLNRAARKLHELRAPLGKSVYYVQGRFAMLRSLPGVSGLQIPPADKLSWDWVTSTQDAARQLARHSVQISDDASDLWGPLRRDRASIQVVDRIRAAAERAIAAGERLRAERGRLSEFTGVSPIETPAQTERALGVIDLLAKGPGVPRGWLEPNALTHLRRKASDQESRQDRRRELEAALAAAFGIDPPAVDFCAARRALELSTGEVNSLETVFGKDWGHLAFQDPSELAERIGDLCRRAQQLANSANSLFQTLGGTLPQSMASIKDTTELARRLLDTRSAPHSWNDAAERKRIATLANESAEVSAAIRTTHAILYGDFEATVIDAADEAMLMRFRTDHQSLLRRTFGSSFRRDQRALQASLRSPRKLGLDEALNTVTAAVELERALSRWEDSEDFLSESLGERFNGLETDFDSVRHDLETLAWFAEFAPGSDDVISAVCDGQTSASIGDALTATEHATRRFHESGAGIEIAEQRRSPMPIVEVVGHLAAVHGVISRVARTTASFHPALGTDAREFECLTSICGLGSDFQELTAAFEIETDNLYAVFGEHFAGERTNWSSVAAALDWTGTFLDQLPEGSSEKVLEQAVHPLADDEYGPWRIRLSNARQGRIAAVDSLADLFEVDATAWESWTAAPAAELEDWLANAKKEAASAPGWLEYREAIDRIDRQIGPGGAERLRKRAPKTTDFPGVLERAIWESWLEDVHTAEPVLGRFTRLDHEALRAKFRELDLQFPLATRDRVRQTAFSDYPSESGAVLGSGQIGILRGELSKKRRQLSVRNLIARIPNLLVALKPCFLMSPLAVSQFLPDSDADDYMFDTVVFDEASQVLPEDALPAIERARQVIVVGDRQQLPPTLFFTRSRDESEVDGIEDEDVDDRLEGRESILDVAVGMVGDGAAECHLGVHYRSRCESLIAFSNHTFYENRLLTFPGPDPRNPKLEGLFLEEATYDAGGTRQNRVEAEQAVQAALELLTTSPDQSVGIVTLSRTQADLVEDLIEQARLGRRDLDPQFDESLPERFFVKNLENVQGDERDHIILSIGYGPTRSGTIPNRFGPINFEGGERRLNVAITRARISMKIIHSLKPNDITSGQPGPRLLRRFIEYARNPLLGPAENNSGEVGEPESPFEEAVLNELKKRGHRVAAQVGVSGYRIDLAIRSEQGSGFDLGIECDGATYHSSPAARDRDWLRQKVLEGLGWAIHRVWSTSYIKNPKREIDAIEDALESSRRGGSLALPPPPTPASVRPPLPRERSESPGPGHLFEEYGRYMGPRPRIRDFSSPDALLTNLLSKIVRAEQPVHVELAVDRASEYSPWPVKGEYRRRFRKWAKEIIAEEIADAQLAYPEPGFLTIANRTGNIQPRRPGDEDRTRPIGRVAMAELDEGLVLVARDSYGIDRGELVRETARQFGWRRTGRRIQAALEERIRVNLERGSLKQEDGMLTVAR